MLASVDGKIQCLSAPLLTVRDWNAEWCELQAHRRCVPDAAFWDERAKTFSKKDAPSHYVGSFLHLAGVRPGERVFDMGCGAGDLAVPLAEAGHQVTAVDFSRGMLGVLKGKLESRKLKSVTPIQMSWNDDWEACGFSPGSFDVCLASRSLTVSDLERALLKLDALARRRVCVTLSMGSSPRTDERVLHALGLASIAVADHLYAFAILARRGIRAELSYIDSVRVDSFDDYDDAYAYYAHMIEESAAYETPERLEHALIDLRAWLPSHLVESNPTEELCGFEDWKPLRTKEPRMVSWAFIAWNKRG